MHLSIYLCLFSMFFLTQNLSNNKRSNIHGFGYYFGGRSAMMPSISSSSLFAEAMEEFHVFEPMELHDAAVDKLVKMRKEVSSGGTNSAFYLHPLTSHLYLYDLMKLIYFCSSKNNLLYSIMRFSNSNRNSRIRSWFSIKTRRL